MVHFQTSTNNLTAVAVYKIFEGNVVGYNVSSDWLLREILSEEKLGNNYFWV